MARTETFPLFCYFLVGFGLILVGVITIWSTFTGVQSDEFRLEHELCNAIQKREDFMMKIKNVTFLKGSPAQIDCKVVKFDAVVFYGRMYWTGPIFQAGGELRPGSMVSKTFRHQYGVNVTGSWDYETFHCDRIIILPVIVSILIFDQINPEHEGWYSCNKDITTGTGFLEEKFYLSVI